MPNDIHFEARLLPHHVRLAERINRKTLAVALLRESLDVRDALPDLSHPGIYVLRGIQYELRGIQPVDCGPLTRIYVGKSEDLGNRLRDHTRKTDWWTEAVIFTSSDGSLHAGHAGWLEASLVEVAEQSSRCRIQQSEPTKHQLPPADAAGADDFLEDVLLAFEILGFFEFLQAKPSVDVLTPGSGPQIGGGSPKAIAGDETDPPSPVFEYRKGDAHARAVCESSGGFRVLKDSRARRNPRTRFAEEYYASSRSALIESGRLVEDGDALRLVEDWIAGSQSEAGTVFSGSAPTTRSDWIASDGTTLKDWLNAPE